LRYRRWPTVGTDLARGIEKNDAAVIRQGLAPLLTDEGIEVPAQACNAEELLQLVNLHQLDVAIVESECRRHTAE
jgi:DNA-binding NarL/FixJ family response regulator